MNGTPWWSWSTHTRADDDPACQGAVAALELTLAAALASQPGIQPAPETWPGLIKVRLGGAEVAVMLKATGVTEKSCALRGCQARFWASTPVTKYHSPECADAATRERKARGMRERRGPSPATPPSVSRLLSKAGIPRFGGENVTGFEASKGSEGVVDVRAYPRELFDKCAATLTGAGYEVDDQGRKLTVWRAA